MNKLLKIKAKKLASSVFLWNYKTAFKWTWLEFSDFREYSFSDDEKYIDFAVSSKSGRTMIRQYEEERELKILFFFDLSETFLFWDDKKKIDTLIETFYLLAFSAVSNGDKIWAYFNLWDSRKFISFNGWNMAISNILKVFDSTNLESVNFEDSLDLSCLMNLKLKNSLVFVFSDKLDLEEKSFKYLNSKNDVVVVNIFDKFENSLEGKGLIWLKNFESNFFINLDNKKKVLEYKKLRSEKIEAFRKKVYKFWANYVFLDNYSNVVKELFKLMKEREK